MNVDKVSLKYDFCPGKAQWFEEIAETFTECRIAYESGILPKMGGMEDQSEIFSAALPAFVDRWKERTYNRLWVDVAEFVGSIFKAFSGK